MTLVLALIVLPRVLPAPAELLGQARAGQWWLWTYTLNIANVFGWLVNAASCPVPGPWPSRSSTTSSGPRWVKRASSRVLRPSASSWSSAPWSVGCSGCPKAGGRLAGCLIGSRSRASTPSPSACLVALAVRLPAWRRRLERIAPAGFRDRNGGVAAMFPWLPRFYPSDWRVVTPFGHSLLALTFGWLVVLAMRTPSHPVLGNGLLRLLGRHSYGIYSLALAPART